jgi:hypothetical protein
MALAVLGLYGIRATLYQGIRSNRIGEFGKLRTLFLTPNDYDMLFIGTSRCETGFIPGVIDSITGLRSFNAGVVGSGFQLQEAVLRAYLEHSRPPRFVVINVDFYALNRENEISHFPRYFPYLSNAPLRNGLRKLDPRIPTFRSAAPYSLTFLNDRYRYAAARGFTGITSSFDRQFQNGFVPAQKKFPDQFRELKGSYGTQDHQDGIDALKEVIRLCRQERIQPILVAAPSFKGFTDRVPSRHQALGLVSSTAQENGLVFLDYTGQLMTADTTLFADLNHLNLQGAQQFSRLVGRDLRTYLSRSSN